MKLSQLFEAFDPFYTVKRVSSEAFDVAKFTDRKEPERVDRVSHAVSNYNSTSPGFYRAGQQDKSILIVKQFLKDGEPKLAHYTVDGDRKITLHKFNYPE